MKSKSAVWHSPASHNALFQYYSRIAPHILPYLKDRPLEFIHDTHLSKFASKSHGMILNLEQLVGCLRAEVREIRAQSVRLDKPHRPDWMVFEIAARDRSFMKTVLTAERCLTEMNLEHLWLCAGPHMLQLMIPIVRRYERAVVFDFSKMIAELITERVGEKMGSHANAIDYSFNHQFRTITAPFSTMSGDRTSHTEIPICLPLHWRELFGELKKNGVSPQYFTFASSATIENAGKLFSKVRANPNQLDFSFSFLEKYFEKIF